MDRSAKDKSTGSIKVSVNKTHLSEYVIGDNIEYGRGGLFYFGSHRRHENEEYFIKIMTKSKLIKNRQEQRLYNEIKMHQLLSQSAYFPELKFVDVTDHRYFSYFFETTITLFELRVIAV